MTPIIIIPSRLQSQRLPRKPLALINGKPMIEHVWQKACQAELGQVYVTSADSEILDVINAKGGNTIKTRSDHPTGSDRIFEAWAKIKEEQNIQNDQDYLVVNFQGDLPTFSPQYFKQLIQVFEDSETDIGTLVNEIDNDEDIKDPNVVKAVISQKKEESKIGKALYFSRSQVPYGGSKCYHHIGVYAYRVQALETFVKSEQTLLEKQEKLEQLRALENGLTITAAIVDQHPIGVDTVEDLEKVRGLFK